MRDDKVGLANQRVRVEKQYVHYVITLCNDESLHVWTQMARREDYKVPVRSHPTSSEVWGWVFFHSIDRRSLNEVNDEIRLD